MTENQLTSCIYVLLVVGVLCFGFLGGCADNKTFIKADGSSITAESYGWANSNKKVPGVEYEVNIGNVVWSTLFIRTAIIPVVFTGWHLYEPVEYTEPKIEK